MKFLILMLIVFSIPLHAIVLKPVNIPENWKIEQTEKTENFQVGEVTVPLMIRQTLQTGGQVVIHYYACPTPELKEKVFQYFFTQNQSVFQDSRMVYRIEADPGDFKNTLRFLEIPLKEQIKLVHQDIEELSGATLQSEAWMTDEAISAAGKSAGITVLDGLTQIYSFADSKARLQVRYFFCKNRNEALTGYKNVRLQKTSDLVNYLFAEQFLAELTWIQ